MPFMPVSLPASTSSGHGLFADAVGRQFGVHVVQPYLVQFVDGHGDVHNLVGRSDHFGNAGENLAVVQLDAHADAEFGEHGVHNLHQFHLVEQRVAAHHVGVTLVKLAVAPLLRPVGPPHRLNLVALERHGQLVAVLHHVAGERDGQVVAQSLLAQSCRQVVGVRFGQLLCLHSRKEIA